MTEQQAAQKPLVGESREIQMEDGNFEVFSGRTRMKKVKVKEQDAEGKTVKAGIEFRFDNGAIRFYALPEQTVLDAALHGLSQHLGDSVAGMKDDHTDDLVQHISEMYEKGVGTGVWPERGRSAGEKTPKEKIMRGGSFLAKALIEHTGKTAETITQYLAGKTTAEKNSLKALAPIAAIIQRLEVERAEKSGKVVDTSELQAELDAI